MGLAAGQRLGPYEIVAPLGAGGMGEVWRARDTRLGRDVAIKVLPAGLAQDEQFRQRFDREAKVISSLSHPHICTLFDVGEARRARSLGAPLPGHGVPRGRGSRRSPPEGSIPASRRPEVRPADRFGPARGTPPGHHPPRPQARQRHAHAESGAKLLDFGLAKTAAEGGAKVDGHTNLATEAKPLTEQGTILGTFQYMSPEQLEGQEADARTDIFALGAVLYEMATGRRAFQGKTKTSLIAAIVKEQPPPIAEAQPLTPPALQHVVDKCLAKDPDDRWQSALDVASELRWISTAGSQAGVAAKVTSSRARRSRLLAVAAVAGWAVATAAVVTTLRVRSELRDASRVTQADLAEETADRLRLAAGGLTGRPANRHRDARDRRRGSRFAISRTAR